jgi:Transposase DDE domain
MAAFPTALARVRRQVLADDLPIAQAVDQLCRDCGCQWRDRLLTPLVTLRLFILQILHGNTAITHLRQLCGIDFAASSYCEARKRLPLEVIGGLLKTMLQWVDRPSPGAPELLGQRVLICDASNHSMSDAPELHEHFGLPPSTKPGIGYPVAKLMGLMDAATGLFTALLSVPLFTHDMRHVLRLHPLLRQGDILLGDRAYCTYAHLALLQLQGVFGCFRLHQRRKCPTGLQRWEREGKAPAWMSAEQFQLLPRWLDVRVIQYTIEQHGFRTRQVWVATTLLDEQAWPDEKLSELYGQRWQIETCFDHLKTTMKMNVLKCQSVDGVMKELAVYLLVHNLVRLAMLKAAQRQQVSVRRISFVDALRWLCCRMLGLGGVEQLLINPYRPNRREPRVIRRRMKEFNLMKRPRAELKNTEKWGENR